LAMIYLLYRLLNTFFQITSTYDPKVVSLDIS
jgi:hypothetical protein